jgi:CheY-like chemotaxis protein
MVPNPDSTTALVYVMVVEDEALVRLLLAERLRESGFSVIEAGRADEALTYIEAGGRVDLVFTDINMPGPINGIDLAREIRIRFPAIPVILTSGAHREEGLGLFIPKPYELEDAVAAVLEALRHNRPEL